MESQIIKCNSCSNIIGVSTEEGFMTGNIIIKFEKYLSVICECGTGIFLLKNDDEESQ